MARDSFDQAGNDVHTALDDFYTALNDVNTALDDIKKAGTGFQGIGDA